MRSIIYYLLILILVGTVSAIVFLPLNALSKVEKMEIALKPLKEFLPKESSLSFSPADSTELYYQAQFALSPIIIDNSGKQDTILVISKDSIYSSINQSSKLLEYKYEDYVITLISTAK